MSKPEKQASGKPPAQPPIARGLFDKKPAPLAVKVKERKVGEPLVVSIFDDVIRESEILPKEVWHRLPRKVRRIAEHSQNAHVAWTAKLGWLIYAENPAKLLRAFYFREDVDDPELSHRVVTGLED